MAETILKFKDITGIVNTMDPLRIPSNALVTGLNVDIDDEFMIHRSHGYTKLHQGNFHSLWSKRDRSLALIVRNDTLHYITPSMDIVSLGLSVPNGCRLSYAEMGNMVIISDGDTLSYFQDYSIHEAPDIDQTFKAKMVGGSIICVYNSRLYAVRGNTIYYSDAVAPFVMDTRACTIQIPGRITMLVPVSDGLYVSDNYGIAFLGGSDPSEFVYTKINESPAVHGMFTTIDGSDLGGGFDTIVATWWSDDGMYMGFPGGVVKQVTNGRYVLNKPYLGTLVCRDDVGFVQLLGTYQSIKEE